MIAIRYPLVPRRTTRERLTREAADAATDLGGNLHGVAVILDLVDRLAALERELAWLRERH